MFRAVLCSSSEGQNCIIQHLVSSSTVCVHVTGPQTNGLHPMVLVINQLNAKILLL